MAKSASLSLTLGMYHVACDAIQTRLPVSKPVMVNGVLQERTVFIPLTKVRVVLTNSKGGSILFQATSMGKRTTVSRKTDLPAEKVRNLGPIGPELVERGEKPQTVSLDAAIGSVMRMTGADAMQCSQLFDFDAIAEHGEMVVSNGKEA